MQSFSHSLNKENARMPFCKPQPTSKQSPTLLAKTERIPENPFPTLLAQSHPHHNTSPLSIASPASTQPFSHLHLQDPLNDTAMKFLSFENFDPVSSAPHNIPNLPFPDLQQDINHPELIASCVSNPFLLPNQVKQELSSDSNALGNLAPNLLQLNNQSTSEFDALSLLLPPNPDPFFHFSEMDVFALQPPAKSPLGHIPHNPPDPPLPGPCGQTSPQIPHNKPAKLAQHNTHLLQLHGQQTQDNMENKDYSLKPAKNGHARMAKNSTAIPRNHKFNINLTQLRSTQSETNVQGQRRNKLNPFDITQPDFNNVTAADGSKLKADVQPIDYRAIMTQLSTYGKPTSGNKHQSQINHTEGGHVLPSEGLKSIEVAGNREASSQYEDFLIKQETLIGNEKTVVQDSGLSLQSVHKELGSFKALENMKTDPLLHTTPLGATHRQTLAHNTTSSAPQLSTPMVTLNIIDSVLGASEVAQRKQQSISDGERERTQCGNPRRSLYSRGKGGLGQRGSQLTSGGKRGYEKMQEGAGGRLGAAKGRRQKKKRTRVEDMDPAEVHVCPIEDCRKKFAKKYNLKIHERRHRGDLPFLCPKCSKKFMWQSSFERHLRVHEVRAGGSIRGSRKEKTMAKAIYPKQAKSYEIERICNTVSTMALEGNLLTVNHLDPCSVTMAASLAMLSGVPDEEYRTFFDEGIEDLNVWRMYRRMAENEAQPACSNSASL